jgi:hypothetical protein
MPVTSTTMPLPPHTPHASTPKGQQLPLLSVATPAPQHNPVDASTGPLQQVPAASTTVWSVTSALDGHPSTDSTGVEQSTPAQFAVQVHTPSSWELTLEHCCLTTRSDASLHSSSEWHWQGTSDKHSESLSGATTPPHRTAPLLSTMGCTTAPTPETQDTVRVRLPQPQVVTADWNTWGVAGTQSDQSETRQRANAAEHSWRLQGTGKAGSTASPATQFRESTTTLLRTHCRFSVDETPVVLSMPFVQGAEHCDQGPEVCQWYTLHITPRHVRESCGGVETLASQRDSGKGKPSAVAQAMERYCTPKPQSTEQALHWEATK